MNNYYYFPFEGTHPVASPFGPRGGGFHAGVDFAWNVAEGPHYPVCAAAEGVVVYYADEGLGGGRTMTLLHATGEQTRYYHLDHPLLGIGAWANLHDRIAISGETGGVAPHLHFQLHQSNGVPVDPLPILQQWDAPPAPIPPIPDLPPPKRKGADMFVTGNKTTDGQARSIMYHPSGAVAAEVTEPSGEFGFGAAASVWISNGAVPNWTSAEGAYFFAVQMEKLRVHNGMNA